MPERKTTKKTYKVGKDESWVDISRKTGIPVPELLAANPGVRTPSAGISINYNQTVAMSGGAKTGQNYQGMQYGEKGYTPNANYQPNAVNQFNQLGLNMNAPRNERSWSFGQNGLAYSSAGQEGNNLIRTYGWKSSLSNYDPRQFGIDPRYQQYQNLRNGGPAVNPVASRVYNYQAQKNGPAFTNTARPIQFGSVMEAGNVGVYPPPNYSNTMPVQFGNVTRAPQYGAAPINSYIQGEKGYNPLQFNYVQPATAPQPTYTPYGTVNLYHGRGSGRDKWQFNPNTPGRKGGGKGGDGYGAPQVNPDGSVISGADWTVSTG